MVTISEYTVTGITVTHNGACVFHGTPEQIALLNAEHGVCSTELQVGPVVVSFETAAVGAPLTWWQRLANRWGPRLRALRD